MHRYTIKELTEKTDYELLVMIVRDRQEGVTNIYSPLNERLMNLLRKLNHKEKLSR